MSILTIDSPTVHESWADPVTRDADSAWWSGFQLGLDGEIQDADPSSDLTPWQMEAFAAGFEAGRRELDQDRMEFSLAYERYLDSMRDERDFWPESEMSEVFGRWMSETGGAL